MTKYNVGAGKFKVPGWTNIDHQSPWYGRHNFSGFIEYDMMHGKLPIADNSADVIYTSHTIEHIKERRVIKFLDDAFISLKRGGVLRITTPDVLLSFAAMSRGDAGWFHWDATDVLPHLYYQPQILSPLEERWLDYVASPLNPNNKTPNAYKLGKDAVISAVKERGLFAALDYFTGLCEYNGEFAGNHIAWWSIEKLKGVLTKIGFSQVCESRQNQSRVTEMRTPHFDSTYPEVSLYIEAIK